ncbi:MAG: DEAD/DEAH box helicase, partial [Candidatus Aminicenantales bacterium]
KPPIFDGMGGKVHDQVRSEMRSILSSNIPFSFLDKVATQQVQEARAAYSRLGLMRNKFILNGTDVIVLSWLGDWANDALALILSGNGLKAESHGMTIIVHNADYQDVLGTIQEIGSIPQPTPEELASHVQNKLKEKWDYLLIEQLLNKEYASRELDIDAAMQFVNKVGEVE